MKQRTLSSLILIEIAMLTSSFVSPSGQTPPPQDGKQTLSIRIKDIDEAKGNLVLSTYTKAENFPKRPESKTTIAADSLIKTAILHLPPGVYAIGIYHDINSNGKMDRNFLGIPTESYGFSNDAKVVMGPPKFKACTFSLHADTTISIRMR